MFKRIRSKIGAKLLITFSVLLVLSMVSLIYIATQMVAEFGEFSASRNEANIRDNANAFLARITHEQAMRYESTFQKIAAFSALIAKQAAFLLENMTLYGKTSLKPSEKLVIYPHNGIFSNDRSKRTMVLYWGSPTMSPVISEQINTLSHLDPLLETVKESNPESVACYAVTEPGFARYYPNIHGVEKLPPTTKFDIRKAHWYVIAKPENNLERKTVWSNIYLDSVGQGLLTTASSPVYSGTGQYLGAAGIDVTLDSIANDILSDIKSPHRMKNMFSFLVDSTGKIIAFPPEYLEMFDLTIDTEKLVDSSVIFEKSLLESSNAEVRRIGKKMIEEPYLVSEFSLNGQPYIFSSHFMPSTGWRLGVVVPESVVFSSVQETRNALDGIVDTMTARFTIVALSFLLGTIIIMVLFTVINIIRPINNLSKAALRVREGDLTTQVDLHREDEIGILAHSFNNMLDTLRKAKELEKEYTRKLEKEVEKRTLELKNKNEELENTLRLLKQEMVERKEAEEALQKSEAKYRSVFDSAGTATVLIQEDMTISAANTEFEKLSGYSREEIEGKKKWTEFVDTEDLKRMKEYHAIRRSKESEALTEYEFRFIDRQGNVKNIFLKTGMIPGTKRSVASLMDITARKQAEEELRESGEKLARSRKMESLGLLAGGVAHDLNNVLSGIVSYPDLLLMDLPEDSKLRKPIETMQESGHRAAAIVQDLLTVARGVVTTKEPMNLNDIVSDYLNSPEFNKLTQFHSTVTVTTNLATDLLNTSGSPVHIRKVVMNLVSNASEAIAGNGNVTISTMNRYIDRPLRGYDDVTIGEYAVLAVSDDGSGISSDDLERIFEPFYTKKVMGRSGTGLGLAVVWNVVQDHKGYIDVISDENGTTFELYFPITRDELSKKDLSIPIKDYKGNGETILVVDDVESQREISCNMLDTLGYKTTAVSSGEEAVEYLKKHTVDLVLLDMIMDPGIDGRVTYERIITIHPNQKAIIVSGFAETDEVKKTQKLGAGKYIKKPITLEKIGLAVKEELEK
jgi:two-component system cell cycle sensor histidine kinase/response regulator CckA